ncbi:hypothetical protein EV178_001484 [Coemansia sp. RSA 1646]|nr:hypothetical protein EV178_001484 [Coemansia sp. RSA 1646]
MAAGSTVLTPKRASVRVTYGSQKNKTPLSSSSSSMLQRVAAPRLAGTYAESPKKRKDDLVGDEDEDEDKDGEEQQDTPSAKKRLVQTSLFLGCQLKAVKKPPVSHAERALTILNIANEHLGAVKLLYEDLLHNERKIMLYISPKGSVEGCILAELIKSARRVAVEEDTQTAESAVRLLDNEEPAVCGISRIWVAPDARRRGVASQMVDILCQRFVYGCQLSRDSLAFTQPTSDGRSLAERVFGRRDFLVYVEE